MPFGIGSSRGTGVELATRHDRAAKQLQKAPPTKPTLKIIQRNGFFSNFSKGLSCGTTTFAFFFYDILRVGFGQQRIFLVIFVHMDLITGVFLFPCTRSHKQVLFVWLDVVPMWPRVWTQLIV